jgi:O-antigen/teichoic acid export membrane protein
MQGMMAQSSLPPRWLPGFLRRVRSDSLVRNSLYLMASTIVTAGLGYIFWAFAAHAFTRQELGIGSAIISLCSTAALFTYLGSFAMLIQRLPASEHSPRWTATLIRVCSVTAIVTAATIAVAVPVLRTSDNYRLFFSSVPPILVAVVGASAWTLVNLLGAAFIAARRAGRLLSIQTLISVAKVLFVFPLAAAGVGATGLVDSWVASSVLGVIVGAVWLVPQMGLGQRSGLHPRRRETVTPHFRLRPHRRPRHRRGLAPPSGESVFEWLGQHLTSAGGVLVPLILPILVVLRLGVVQNAYFYITEMMGAAFFMVSPSVAQAIFAEGVRARSELRSVVIKALRVIAALLVPAMAIMILGGKLILRLFGTPYATAGYALLILLAISAVPDAVSNVAVTVCRVTHKLGYSTGLNLGILVITLGGAWFLMPLLGITGVGVAWLGAQTIGAIASLPVFAYTGKSMAVSPASPSQAGAQPGETLSERGIALLIEIADQQSLGRLNSP